MGLVELALGWGRSLLVRLTAAYVATASGAVQLLSSVGEAFEWPSLVVRISIVVFLLGLGVVVPWGIWLERRAKPHRASGVYDRQRHRMGLYAIGAIAMGALMFGGGYYLREITRASASPLKEPLQTIVLIDNRSIQEDYISFEEFGFGIADAAARSAPHTVQYKLISGIIPYQETICYATLVKEIRRRDRPSEVVSSQDALTQYLVRACAARLHNLPDSDTITSLAAAAERVVREEGELGRDGLIILISRFPDPPPGSCAGYGSSNARMLLLYHGPATNLYYKDWRRYFHECGAHVRAAPMAGMNRRVLSGLIQDFGSD